MSLLRPFLLWFGLLPPLLLIGYALLQRRRRVAVPQRALLRRAGLATAGWQHHLAPVLLLVASSLLIVAMAGPTITLTLASEQQTIILALDASGSMEARDIEPNRLQASQAAAKALVLALPRLVRVGVVSYADSPQLVQPPTLHRGDVLAAIERVRVAGGTAIGDAMVLSLAALFPGERVIEAGAPAAVERGAKERARPGSYRSAAIVLLTDGQNSSGMSPLEAARIVAGRGVKVYAVGFGTRDGVLVGPENIAVQVSLDEDTLRGIAEATGGEYFHASSAMELRKVYAGLESRLTVGREDTEVTALFAAAAALLIVLGAGLSLCWFGRIA
jgi:Ca-activated chloride channel family protein